ncbi:MAG: CotH kinase family protein, partial [Muribaculaceae bacterium]|nr:CotH kinase family protein [Muribaculaceae bacterium]
MKRIQLIILALVSAFIASGQNQVLQIFKDKKYTPVQWVDISDFQIVENEDSLTLNITPPDDIFNIVFADSIMFQTGISIPHIEITTEEDLQEIPNKTDYKKATFTLNGFGNYDNVATAVNIRGRGNTSWAFDKKPYRLKFDKKISLCGLPKAKNYVLLANYTDPSLMQFALATKLGQMLGMPYTNQVVPVDITLNGIYHGSYLLTNKPGINSGS